MNESPAPSRVKTVATFVLVVVAVLSLIVLQSLALDAFTWLTSGSWVEAALNWISRAYLWVAVGVGVIIAVGIAFRRNDS